MTLFREVAYRHDSDFALQKASLALASQTKTPGYGYPALKKPVVSFGIL